MPVPDFPAIILLDHTQVVGECRVVKIAELTEDVLDQLMCHDNLAHLGKVKLADKSATAIRHDSDEALRCEPVDRLPCRCAAQFELLEQQCFIDPATGGQGEINDPRPNEL